MLSLPGKPVRTCEGISRREWLCAGGLSPLGLGLPDLLGRRAAAAAVKPRREGSFGRAKSCVVVFLFGAPAHQDIWDLKPEAPAEVRGEFKPIASRVPGILVGEHIPRIAQETDQLAIVRSVSHPDNTHTVALHYMLTGHRHLQPQTNPQTKPTDFPAFGAVIQHLRPGKGPLPSGISLNAPANQVSANNHIFPGFHAGFLGAASEPLFVPQDPNKPDFRPFPSIDAPVVPRYLGRQNLLAEVARKQNALSELASTRPMASHYQKAFQLVTSPEARRAFDLANENDRVRDRYGRNPFGQAMLLSRRLVEAGVELVTVNWERDDAYWDTHAKNFSLLKDSLLPPFDLGFSAFLDDMTQRGLLDDTLVIVLAEFGRTPRINAAAGRDHWAPCNTVVFAGGGVQGGKVIGASDRIAAYPASAPISPSDVSATLYHALGIDYETTIRDHMGRPLPLSPGRPVEELFRA